MTETVPRKVVVFRIGSIGDTVVALPCFHAIRRAFPDAYITLLTNIPTSTKAAPLMMVLGYDIRIHPASPED